MSWSVLIKFQWRLIAKFCYDTSDKNQETVRTICSAPLQSDYWCLIADHVTSFPVTLYSPAHNSILKVWQAATRRLRLGRVLFLTRVWTPYCQVIVQMPWQLGHNIGGVWHCEYETEFTVSEDNLTWDSKRALQLWRSRSALSFSVLRTKIYLKTQKSELVTVS